MVPPRDCGPGSRNVAQGEYALLLLAFQSCVAVVDTMAVSPALLFMDRFVVAVLPLLL